MGLDGGGGGGGGGKWDGGGNDREGVLMYREAPMPPAYVKQFMILFI